MKSIFKNFQFSYKLKSNSAFIWDQNKEIFQNIKKYKSIPLNLLIGIQRQKNTLMENTMNFAKGNISNSALSVLL